MRELPGDALVKLKCLVELLRGGQPDFPPARTYIMPRSGRSLLPPPALTLTLTLTAHTTPHGRRCSGAPPPRRRPPRQKPKKNEPPRIVFHRTKLRGCIGSRSCGSAAIASRACPTRLARWTHCACSTVNVNRLRRVPESLGQPAPPRAALPAKESAARAAQRHEPDDEPADPQRQLQRAARDPGRDLGPARTARATVRGRTASSTSRATLVTAPVAARSRCSGSWATPSWISRARRTQLDALTEFPLRGHPRALSTCAYRAEGRGCRGESVLEGPADSHRLPARRAARGRGVIMEARRLSPFPERHHAHDGLLVGRGRAGWWRRKLISA